MKETIEEIKRRMLSRQEQLAHENAWDTYLADDGGLAFDFNVEAEAARTLYSITREFVALEALRLRRLGDA